ncbi:calcium-binding protein [Ramlibacter sp. AN1015]|uniref:calcium-binding protein n=1 Tax=Ramlibacter sp. AN1015 TaxID=3133428 RepID=UPI0030BA474D
MRRSITRRPRVATPALAACLLALLAGCGGGGGGEDPLARSGAGSSNLSTAAAPADKGRPGGPSGSNGVRLEAETGDLLGSDKPNMLRGTDADDVLRGQGGHDVLFALGGNDWLYGGSDRDRMVGGPGDDQYLVEDADDQVVERDGEGTDHVHTTVSFTLPEHVENLSAHPEAPGPFVLTGNELANHIVGSPFSYDTIYGLGGDDVLEGGGRHGAMLDGGEGRDRLIVSFGELRGGPGADTFVAAGRGAHTSPEVPVTVLDFNAAEGDRIEIPHVQTTATSAELFVTGKLRFDPVTSTLVLDLQPTVGGVDQVMVLEGVKEFNPAWVTVGTPKP